MGARRRIWMTVRSVRGKVRTMATITAAMVKELREISGAGMMDCKNALTENDGNMEASVDWLRAKGITVFTIAYDVTDKQVTTLLKSCAPGKYFEPDVGGNSINLVFSEITAQISNELVRLVR